MSHMPLPLHGTPPPHSCYYIKPPSLFIQLAIMLALKSYFEISIKLIVIFAKINALISALINNFTKYINFDIAPIHMHKPFKKNQT